ncbi:ABC transporter ATP-binding protein [Hahella ganghwensis]|uniref:ABC transporter ATP-binding protein n=1 Tax=Hahella ganghwensis TaxID=286420 RepID=UPI00037D4486|nr:ABC transporter ATP-binding protein [Hahella ganghwensis]
MTDYALELDRVSKRFGAVQANKDVSLNVVKGSIHGIVGENGAGKSTLMSILYGFYQADSGSIKVFGKTTDIPNSHAAIAAGIGMVHQHFMLVEPFTVLENVILGNEGSALLTHSQAKARKVLQDLSSDYNLKVDPDAVVGDLPVGLQQRVEILKALYKGARILILDEPTGVLTPQETDDLLQILEGLKEQGVTVLLITHKLKEIMAVTDNVSVMRHGEMVAHLSTEDTSPEELAELMVGRKVVTQLEKPSNEAGEPVLTVEGLSVVDSQNVERVKKVSFSVAAGEIVGVAGVSGNGQTELMEALSGMRPVDAGTISYGNLKISPGTSIGPDDLRHAGIAHVPEDRHRVGLVTAMSASENSILGYHRDDTWNQQGLLKPALVEKHCAGLMAGFDVRPQDPKLKSANFSGGNQQKLILARELDCEPKVLLVGQPTRGVDIGAIEFIHTQLLKMRNRGGAILLISVELDEILALSDRIIVMCDGCITGEVSAKDADERTLGLMMSATSDSSSTSTEEQAE